MNNRLSASARLRLRHGIAILEAILNENMPADTALGSRFTDRNRLESADRAFITELVYTVLRYRRTLEAGLGGPADCRQLATAALAALTGHSSDESGRPAILPDAEHLAQIMQIDRSALAPAIRSELPDWLYRRLVAQWGEEKTLELADALCRPAPVDLRINPHKANRQAVLDQLRGEGLHVEASPYSPLGMRMTEKTFVQRHRLFLEGKIEIQDEGSQLIALLLGARRGETIADFCAGAGGKALLIGSTMRNTGRVHAIDISAKRLANLKPRLERSGLNNIHPLLIDDENDPKLGKLIAKFDRVLVDAPCSGLGTLRRQPDLKWRYTEDMIAKFQDRQHGIINAASSLVKPGGRLVYATCSLLTAENDEVVDVFLSTHPEFKSISARNELAKQQIHLETADRLLLLPHLHGCDGFFACALERAR